jgi:hypothetical protein
MKADPALFACGRWRGHQLPDSCDQLPNRFVVRAYLSFQLQ